MPWTSSISCIPSPLPQIYHVRPSAKMADGNVIGAGRVTRRMDAKFLVPYHWAASTTKAQFLTEIEMETKPDRATYAGVEESAADLETAR
jgi:hypothetical protein